MEHFEYTGHTTLETLGDAHKLNQWMYSAIRPFLKGTVFEFGSGTGTFSELALKEFRCFLSDYEMVYCDDLDKRFRGNPNYLGSHRIDLNVPLDAAGSAVQGLQGTIDSIFAINVLEHIRHHDIAVESMRSLLKPGGRIVLFVPALPMLFNHLDKALGHERRYTKQSCIDLVTRHSMKPLSVRYFNPFGIPGWAFMGGIAQKTSIPRSGVKLYEQMLPLAQLMNGILSPLIGLSLIVCAEKI